MYITQRKKCGISEFHALFTLMPVASGHPSSHFAVLRPGTKFPDRKQDFAPGYSGCKDKDFVLLPETQLEV
jgi:hypothetical protein